MSSIVRPKSFHVITLASFAFFVSGCTFVASDHRLPEKLGANRVAEVHELMAKVDEDPATPLGEVSWIPFTRLRVASFSKVSPEAEEPQDGETEPAQDKHPGAVKIGPVPVQSPHSLGEDGLPGYSLTEWRSYGPLFLFSDIEDSRYNEDQQLYEQRRNITTLLQIFSVSYERVSVPSGWRDAMEVKILGLLPIHNAVYYVDGEHEPPRRSKQPERIQKL